MPLPRPARRTVKRLAGGNPVAIPLMFCPKPLIGRVSSAVEQRFCKPLVGSSILSPGTNKIRYTHVFVERDLPGNHFGQTMGRSADPSETDMP